MMSPSSTSSVKKGLIKSVWAVVLLLAGALLGTYAYIQSNHFRQSISDTLSTVLGESVELGDDLNIDSVYPQIKITLPNAKLRASPTSDGLNRARIKNLQANITYQVLFSGGTQGKVEIKADELSVITQSSESGEAPEEAISNSADSSQAYSSIAEQLRSVKNRLSGFDIKLSLSELNYYTRNEQTGNSAYRLSNIKIDSLYGENIQASASVLQDDEIKHALTMEVRDAKNNAQQPNKSMEGTYRIDLETKISQETSHQLQGAWVVHQNDLTLKTLEYKSDEAWLRGDLTLTFSQQNINNIVADLELRQWDINASTPATNPSDQSSPSRLFSYELFTTFIPENLEANIGLYLGAIRLDETPLINGQLQLAISEGTLDVSSQDMTLLGGATELSLQLDNSQSNAVGLKLKLEADDVQLERIRSSANNDTFLSSGEADIIIALRGSGPSPGHIASTMDGYVIATVSAAQVKQKYSTLIDIGVVNWAFERLSLLSKDGDAEKRSADISDPLTIECASLRLYINDGKVEVSNGAIIELQDNVLFSSGYIDLKNETMGFAFRTKGRSLFDWSAISIAKYAEIGGSLSDPAITLNSRELAKQGVLSASSIAWGPLPSLVYSLAESGVKNMQSDQCTPEIK